jgi:hypothetical protein
MKNKQFFRSKEGVIFGKFPFVASPFDRDLARRSKLVGFLLHPVPRSGTWRRLMLSRPLSLPLAQGFFGGQQAWRTCRFGGKITNRQHLNFTEKQPFSQDDGTGLWITNPRILLSLQIINGFSQLVVEAEHERERRFVVWGEWALRASALSW